ncbi:MAG: pyridoxamine 5'-phosphate oxidase family protein [Tetrasphaera sp.]
MSPDTFPLDTSEASAETVQQRLESDIIGWLTTVRPDGRPHAVPVWFLWQGNRALIMSEPITQKVENVRNAPHTLLHLHTDETGNGVVVLTGTAAISNRSSTEWLPEIRESYTAKYAAAMERFGMGLNAFAEQFSLVIEFTPTTLTVW